MPGAKQYTTRTRIMRIMRALIERPYGYTIQQLADRYGVHADTIRGDFEACRNADFILDMDDRHRYAFVPDQPLRQLKELLHFTEEDQFLLDQAIDLIAVQSVRGDRLKRKLASLYDFRKLGHSYLRKPYLSKIDRVQEAREKKVRVILRDYRSSNSNTVTDRLVEPFHASPADDILHAYDVVLEKIRHYRISRFTRVEMTDAAWEFEHRHIVMPTDPFRIVDAKQVNVHIRMRVGAYNELVERFPVTRAYLQESHEPDVFDFQCMVNHQFLGLTNFILGHHHQVIEVLEPEALIDLLNSEAKKMKF